MDPLYLACFKRDNYHCRSCNDTRGLHLHHVVFRSQQGKNELINLITLCWQCHRAVHDGKLSVTVLEITQDNVVVRFERKNGWVPK